MTLPFEGIDMSLVHQKRKERRGRFTVKSKISRVRHICENPTDWLCKPEPQFLILGRTPPLYHRAVGRVNRMNVYSKVGFDDFRLRRRVTGATVC